MHIPKIGCIALALCLAAPLSQVKAAETTIQPQQGIRAWVEVSPDDLELTFTCFSQFSPGITYCSPLPYRYGNYMDNANWRMSQEVSMPGTCVHNRTYGYTDDSVWVAGECTAIFTTPNLRYGNGFDHQGALESFEPTLPPPSVTQPSSNICCGSAR